MNDNRALERYTYYCNNDADISEHLPTLLEYASLCDTIVELGTRYLVSTFPFLLSMPKELICVDIVHPKEYIQGQSNLDIAFEFAKDNNIDFRFIHANDLEIDLPESDLIFIDTDHTYEQLKAELALHGNKAKQFLIFHDTNIESMTEAIYEFLAMNNNWEMLDRVYNDNGLIVLGRIYK